MYGNASLSFYLPSSGEPAERGLRPGQRMKLGDVAQSMTIHDGTAYIVVNNSRHRFRNRPGDVPDRAGDTGYRLAALYLFQRQRGLCDFAV